MTRLAASVTVMVTLLACLLVSGAGAADLTMLSPYSRNFIIDQEVTQRYLVIVQSLGSGEELSIRLFGPDVVPPFWECLDAFDVNASGTIDLRDVFAFQRAFRGPR